MRPQASLSSSMSCPFEGIGELPSKVWLWRDRDDEGKFLVTWRNAEKEGFIVANDTSALPDFQRAVLHVDPARYEAVEYTINGALDEARQIEKLGQVPYPCVGVLLFPSLRCVYCKARGE